MKERICNKCNVKKPLDSENFHKGKGKYGFRYICKSCRNSYRRKYRFFKDAFGSSNIDAVRKVISDNKILKEKYGKYIFNLAQSRRLSYLKIDNERGRSNDLDTEFVINEISKQCVYCGEKNDPRGLDRIFNNKGHLKNNVVPCCAICNTTRSDRFTHEEMFLIGETIKIIKKNRI